MKLSDAICEIMLEHITHNNGLIMGETLTSIGNTYGTIPKGDFESIVELPMSDVAASGFATGAALVGRKTVFVLRFQDFLLLNCSSLLQDAAISKDFHGQQCPVFIRAIASEKAGPNHSNSFHSIPMHFPGINVCAPMSELEYREVYKYYLDSLEPIYVSEDRRSLTTDLEYENVCHKNADISLLGIADARLEISSVVDQLQAEGYVVNVGNILWLKPFNEEVFIDMVKHSKITLVIDSDREICGASEHIAYNLMKKTGKIVYAMGSDDCVKTLRPDEYHLAPKSRDIYRQAKELLLCIGDNDE